ncbi:uncharacterized protein DNG_01807 [Cephalotrichum gorgonifer]|uniref:C2H2-type domain-containing protein n=1 Tax=Cephalotrichum gorgonifer TaxID=2041049 RepID=A0AAE8MRF8_9PEZI|nr:uncharacterized protein DNG_01807 [Cephalotrichum gorgonifer]
MSAPLRPSTVTPHFAYTERFEGGAVYSGISAGRGKLIPVETAPRAPYLVFSVEKDRLRRTISIDIQSRSLIRTILNALDTYPEVGADPQPLDLNTLLRNYDVLKQHLEALESQIPAHLETSEFRLLIEDFLLERAVFDGIGLEPHPQHHGLSQTQLRDIHDRSIDTGLDGVDDCFRLGFIPSDMTDDYVAALSKRHAHLALPDELMSLEEPSPELISFASHHDPVFSSKSLEPEPPTSYSSFSNLAVRIKGPLAKESFPGAPDAPLDTLQNSIEPVDAFFKMESPLRKQEQHDLGGYVRRSSSGIFTSLSALENTNSTVGFGNAAPPPRGRASSCYDGIGITDPVMAPPLSNDIWGPPTSRSEGVPETRMGDPFNWKTESDTALFGDRENRSVPAVSMLATTGHNTPRTSGSCLPSISRKESQSALMKRQRLGRNLIASLTSLCRTVRDAIGKTEVGSPESTISAHFTSFIRVWNEGLGVFRQIINNHPPRGLLEVLDCLVVASAMCTVMSTYNEEDDDSMYLEFVNDVLRWRSILDPDDHPLFDKVNFALWFSLGFPDPTPGREDKDSLARFQELMQDIVTLEKENPRAPARTAPYATRLRDIQQEYAAKEDRQPRGQATSDPVSIPIPSGGARKRVYDESLDMEPEVGYGFSINDVFDVDRFLAQSVDSESTADQVMDLGWNDILSTTVLLLASTAFSVLLTLTTVIQRDFDSQSIVEMWRRPRGYSRSCDIVGHFLESVGGFPGGFREVPLYRPHSLDHCIKRLSLSTMSAPSSGQMWTSSSRTRTRTSVVPSSSQATAIEMSLSHSLGAVREPKRLRCLSANCSKTFSSVSNRNKHMREGCQHREKNGYRCRNGPCTKVLTTKWYRNTHEQERCRHKGVAGGQGGGG